MACCQLMSIKNPNYLIKGAYKSLSQYIEVPCGWCLNCRVDKQNWLTDAMEYEQKNYDYICAFVTFTYDDIYIRKLSNIVPDDFEIVRLDNGKYHLMPFNNNKPVNYTLSKKDPKDFLKRLRSKIDYYYKKNNITNCDLCRKDFKYFMSAEYGDIFGRPHYHFVFFGLDWNFCQDIFYECWQKGLIDSKPVKSGCFQYVTKYLTKQLHSKQAKEVYDDNNLVRPFSSHSLGLGKGIILDQFDFIKSHNLQYLNNNDSLRPIPIYYRRAFLMRPKQSYELTNIQMIQTGIKPDLPKDRYYLSDSKNTTMKYSLKKMNEYRRQQALIRHQKLKLKLEASGKYVEPLIKDSYSSTSNIHNLVIDSLKSQGYSYIDGELIPF